jgi:3-carboxy-cis,cis-muconate cycloisomerase
MFDFEVALVRAQAALGVIPALATDKIAEAARAERYDLARLGEEAAAAGDIVAPLVKALAAEVAKADSEAARYVHWGASSQDAIDTALVLELRAGIDVLLADLNRAIDGFTALAGRLPHRRGMHDAQHNLPIRSGSGRAMRRPSPPRRLRRLRKEALVLQFGGAAARSLRWRKRPAVTDRLAACSTWQCRKRPGTDKRHWPRWRQRSRSLRAAAADRRDVTLLMQTEVAEAFEPARRGEHLRAAQRARRRRWR